MRIAGAGDDKVGRLMEDLPPASGVEVDACFDLGQPLVAGAYRVALDFTTPDAVVGNVRRAAALGIHLVVGTTGWDAERETVRKIVDEAGLGMVYRGNFLIGVDLVFRIAQQT